MHPSAIRNESSARELITALRSGGIREAIFGMNPDLALLLCQDEVELVSEPTGRAGPASEELAQGSRDVECRELYLQRFHLSRESTSIFRVGQERAQGYACQQRDSPNDRSVSPPKVRFELHFRGLQG